LTNRTRIAPAFKCVAADGIYSSDKNDFALTLFESVGMTNVALVGGSMTENRFTTIRARKSQLVRLTSPPAYVFLPGAIERHSQERPAIAWVRKSLARVSPVAVWVATGEIRLDGVPFSQVCLVDRTCIS
jgi:hypothetical protein